MIDLANITGFDWDVGNACKNEKHAVSSTVSEQVFFSKPLLMLPDVKHSNAEPRFHALGKTGAGRLLQITFTLRHAGLSIRVISARDMDRKEGSIMKKRLKPIPAFADEAEERAFWETHDTTEYLDWSLAQNVVLPNLKPSTQTISLRLPQHLLDAIKSAANARDVPYQSLIKVWLQEKLQSL